MASSTPFYQKLILWGALAATVVAALLVEDEAELSVNDVVQAVVPATESSAGRGIAGQTRQIHETLSADQLNQLGKRQFSARADDIFAAISWEPEHAVSAGPDEQAFQARQEEARREEEARRRTPPPSPGG